MTRAQRKALELIRDTGRPYTGLYRHNIRQWEMWSRMEAAGLFKRGRYTAHFKLTPAGKAALARKD
ncbi:MAG TPA: hypothetical protein VIU44_07775 [Gaiellaceae bacterium]